mmetsp:Transcript_21605/g.42446  ORF Transcript_21605/g.42446 Transcript_21605/m.42446 type:complete len:662 (-) Transcript_21605:55-2040(-)
MANNTVTKEKLLQLIKDQQAELISVRKARDDLQTRLDAALTNQAGNPSSHELNGAHDNRNNNHDDDDDDVNNNLLGLGEDIGNETHDSDIEVEDLKRNLKNAEEKNRELEMELERLQAEQDASRRALLERQDSSQLLAETQEELLAKKREASTAGDERNALQKQCNNLHQELAEVQEANAHLKKELATVKREFEEKVAALDEELLTVREDFARAAKERDNAQRQRHAAELEPMQMELQATQQNLENSQAKVERLQSEIDEQTKQITVLKEALVNAESNAELANAEVSIAGEAALREAEEKLQAAKTSAELAQAELEELLHARNSELENIKVIENEHVAEIGRLKEELEKSQSRLAAAIESSGETEVLISELQEELKAKEREFEDAQAGQREAQQLLVEAQSELHEVRNSLEELEQSSESQLMELKEKLLQVNREREEKELELSSLRENELALHAQKRSAEAELSALRDQVDTAQDEMIGLREDLNKARDYLEETKTDLHQSREQLRRSGGELQQAQDQIGSLEARCESQILKVQELRAELEHVSGDIWSDPSDLDDVPAPPFGLDDPVIENVFANWTQDSAKINMFRGWCKGILAGEDVDETTMRKKLEIINLKPEVCQGFTQLIVPILRAGRPDLAISAQTKAQVLYSLRLKVSSNSELV